MVHSLAALISAYSIPSFSLTFLSPRETFDFSNQDLACGILEEKICTEGVISTGQKMNKSHGIECDILLIISIAIDPWDQA